MDSIEPFSKILSLLLSNCICFVLLFVSGALRSYLVAPARCDYRISFDMESVEARCRLKIGRRLREVFKEIHQQYGGFVQRLTPSSGSNAMAVTYHVMICTKARSDGIMDDVKLGPLWDVIFGEFDVNPNAINTSQGMDNCDVGYRNKFIVVASEDDPEDWSHYLEEDFCDDNSVFSFRSHA
jgi:hypothetical protein